MDRVTGLFANVAFSTGLFFFASAPNAFADNKVAAENVSHPGLIVVMQPTDAVPANAVKLESIVLGDSSVNSYTALIRSARMKAADAQANIIKINELKTKNKANIYDYMSVTLYKAENPRKLESEFSWSKERRLTWDDFRGPIRRDMGEMVAAATFCGFGFETNTISKNNPKLKIFVSNTFLTNKSWGRPADMTPEVLVHEQGHFDLCEVYTRMLRRDMNNAVASINVSNLEATLNNIYDRIQKEYAVEQERYEHETEHGLVADAQQNWVNHIDRELTKLDSWAE
jgi:hypothetical protein